MSSLIHPIYVDGPLEGQDFPAAPGVPVRAIHYGTPNGFSLSLTADIATYQMRRFAFHSGGKAVSFWVGWCSPVEPDAVTVFRVLCKPELFGRAETLDMPAPVTRQQRSNG